MAIQTTAVVRAQCDACPQVVYADAPKEPKGFQGTVREVDGNGQIREASYFACQLGHVGAAAKKVLQAAKAVGARPAVAPVAVIPAPEPYQTPEHAGREYDPFEGDQDEQAG